MENDPNTPPAGPEYSIEPLQAEDVRTLHELARGVFHNTRRSDHQGTWRSCGACFTDAEWGAFALARREKDGPILLDTREKKLDWVAGSRTNLTRVMKDGRGYERPTRGVDASPAAAVKTKGIQAELSCAVEAGRLHTTVEVASLVLQYALAFFSDPGERPELGYPIPFKRIAKSMSGNLLRDVTREEVAAIWAEIEVLEAPKIHAKIAQQGSQHLCGQVPQVADGQGRTAPLVHRVEQNLLAVPSEPSEFVDLADDLRWRAIEIVEETMKARKKRGSKVTRAVATRAVRNALEETYGRLDDVDLASLPEFEATVDAVMIYAVDTSASDRTSEPGGQAYG